MSRERPPVRIAWVRVAQGAPRRDSAWRVLAGLLPDGARLRNPCPRCGGPHGAVVVDGAPYVASVTYAGGWAIAAVAATGDAAALGIDAEPAVDPRRDAAGLTGVLGERPATVRDWTRVEAALKADGRGLRVDPAAVALRSEEGGWTARVPGGGVLSGWDAGGPPGVVVSVAIREPGSRAR